MAEFGSNSDVESRSFLTADENRTHLCYCNDLFMRVGRNLWEERAEHGSLCNDRLLSLACLCAFVCVRVCVSCPLSFVGSSVCSTCQPNLSFPCAGGLNVALLIYKSVFRKENVYDLPTGQLSNGLSMYQKTTRDSIQSHFVQRCIDFFVQTEMFMNIHNLKYSCFFYNSMVCSHATCIFKCNLHYIMLFV